MKWVEFVKQYAKKHNIKYGEALKKAKGDWAEHKKTLAKTGGSKVGGSFDPDGNRVPKKNVGKLVRKDANEGKKKDSKNPNEKSPKGGNIKMSIQEGDKPVMNTKAQRARRVRQYNKALKEVASGLRVGKLDQEEFNDFVGLARALQKSDKDKYAKAIKKLTKEFNSKKYQKLLGKKRQTKLTEEQEGEQFQTQAKRTIALQTGAKVGAQQRKAINTRVDALKRLGVSEEDATNIAREEARQQQELKTLTAGIGGKRLTGAKIGMSYPQFVKSLQDKNNISYQDAVQLASSNNLWKRYQIEQLKANPSAILGTFVPPVGQPAVATQAVVDRRALLKRDGTLKKVHRDNVDKFFRTWGKSSTAFNLSDRSAVLGKAKTLNQAEKAQELANKLSTYPTLNPLEKSRLEAISASLQGYIADPSTAFRRSGRPPRRGATTATSGSDTGVAQPPNLTPIPQSPSGTTPRGSPSRTLPAVPGDSGAGPATPTPTTFTPSKITRMYKTRESMIEALQNGQIREGQQVGHYYKNEDGVEKKKRFIAKDNDGVIELHRKKAIQRRRVSPSPAPAGASGVLPNPNLSDDPIDDGSGGSLDLKPEHEHHLDIAEQVNESVGSRNGSFGEYLYNESASNGDHAVYVNEPNKCVLIAIKGRKGGFNERKYQEDKHYVKEIKLLLPKYKVELTGVGSGAEYVEKIGRVEKLPIVLFNHKKHKVSGKDVRKGGSLEGREIAESRAEQGLPPLTGGGFDDAIINHEVENFKVHQGDFLHNNPEGGSMSVSSDNMITSYHHPNLQEGELGENDEDGNRAEGEGEPAMPLENREMESALGSYGGSLDNLAVEKLHHSAHKTEMLRNEYTPSLVAMKAQSLDKTSDFKKYNRDFDRKVGAIKTDMGILNNYIQKIGDKHLRKDLTRSSNALKEELNNFLKNIRQVFAQNRTLKFKNRLGNDRSVLKDTSVEEAVEKGGGLIGGMSGTYQGSGSDAVFLPKQNPFVLDNPASGSGRSRVGRVSNSSIRSLGGGALLPPSLTAGLNKAMSDIF